MKKLMTIMACFAMILVGGLTLAGCGGPTETEISATEAQTFINSQDFESKFAGGYLYKMAGGILSTQVKFNNGNIAEFKYESNQSAENFKLYIKDGKAYLDTEDTKVWANVQDIEDTEYGPYFKSIMDSVDVTHVTNLVKQQAVVYYTKFIKKVDGNKTELVCSGEHEGVTAQISLTFVDGKLEKVVGSQKGQEVLTLETLNTIVFPDLVGYEEYQEPSIEVDPEQTVVA